MREPTPKSQPKEKEEKKGKGLDGAHSCTIADKCPQVNGDFSYLATVDVFDGLFAEEKVDIITVLQ